MLEIASQLVNGHFRNTFFCSKAGLQMSRKSAILPNCGIPCRAGFRLILFTIFIKAPFHLKNDLVMT